MGRRRRHDRDPVTNWVTGRIALTGDAAHPPLQNLAQGAVMRARDVRDHSLVDWLYGPTALSADQLPPMFSTVDRPEPDSSSGLAPPRRLVGTRPPTWHE